MDPTLSRVPVDLNNIFAVPSRPSSVTSSRSKRRKPNRTNRVRIPSIRKVPSNLYAIAPSQSAGRSVFLTEVSLSQGTLMCGQLKAFPGITSQHETHSVLNKASRIIAKPVTISIPEVKRIASASSPPEAGVHPASITIPKLGPTFIDILTENKRKNRHAPAMVSMLNPLRDKIPSRAWVHLPYREYGKEPFGSFFLQSPRFKRVFDSRLTRSRSKCEWESDCFAHGKAYLFKNIHTHCHFCKRESLRTKILVISHYQQQAQKFQSTQNGEGDIVRKKQTTLNNDDPLNSPRLCDLDDFDEFDKDIDDDVLADVLLFDEISLDDMDDDLFNGR